MIEIAIPQYMADHVATLRCRNCRHPMATSGVLGVGVHKTRYVNFCLNVEVACGVCGEISRSATPEHRLSPTTWATQLAKATPCPKRSRNSDGAGHHVENSHTFDAEMADAAEQAARSYWAVEKAVLDCALGHFDAEEGGECVTITFASAAGDVDRPVAIRRDDARLLACGLLVALASRGDQFAQGLLDDRFPAGHDGRFHWPRTAE